MKGQVFLLTAGIIIAVLVALKGFATVQQISFERDILDVSLENLAFRNIDNEIKQLVEISATTPMNISNNTIDFLNFTRRGSDGHALDFRILFVGILANSTNQTMDITVFQFLRENNLNVTIKLNTTPIQSNTTLLNDGNIWINNFSFTAGQMYDFTVILPDKNYEENVTIGTNPNKDTYTEFFDLRLLSEHADHIDKFQKTVKIS